MTTKVNAPSVLLYHYSGSKYDILLTRKRQGIPKPDVVLQTSQEIKPGDYTEHISFFVDPAPLDILSKVYRKHDVWHKGNILYEHTVDLALVGDFKYHFVETPEKIQLLFDDSVSVLEYYNQLNKINKNKHYIGASLDEFMYPYNSFKGTTRDYILKAPSYPNWESNRHKYAACVPHVMLYPKTGEVTVSSVKQVTIL